ncbi:MAG TPA: IgGFc-binding protein [Polyangiaceae bacterium]
MRSSRTTELGPRVRTRRSRALARASAALAVAVVASCTLDSSDRWTSKPAEPPPACTLGDTRCAPELERCEEGDDGATWVLLENCTDQDLVCAAGLVACTSCVPGSLTCDAETVLRCRDDGSGFDAGETCDEAAGEACREGGCQRLCLRAAEHRSNVGCEYWAVDLDNARVTDALNAASQQFAVIVSNVQPDVTADVVIEQDDTAPGEEGDPVVVARASIPPFSLRVFQLGPREVDGSAPGEFNSGTHTALTRSAYRIRTTFPVVAYQFNPLENVGVFSNDASLLRPVEAVTPQTDEMADAYVALGWPQTIASTDDPRTNFSASDPIDLRAFLTIVGTRPGTTVRVTPTTRVLGAPGVPETDAGAELEVTLDPFDVLNLETDDFRADLTGTVISANGPVIVFTGSEASDAPYFDTLTDRHCCADHLEEQIDHLRTAGNHFVASPTPNRSRALRAAGAAIGVAEQADYFRILAVSSEGAHMTTSHPDHPSLDLFERGEYIDIASSEPFTISSDAPIQLMSVSPSQFAAGVPNDLPGGDPSLIVIPPIEQFRTSYVFQTPAEYAFDFVRILAPEGAEVVFDSRSLDDLGCTSVTAGRLEAFVDVTTKWVVHTCQLGFPIVDPNLRAPDNVLDAEQSDGVHVIEADRKIGVLVNGFDTFVGYAYAAGTELEFLVER